jgi:hypothetical protein
VKNTSGVSKVFSFLPTHGRRLAPVEEFTFIGSPTEAISRGVGFKTRHLAALETALVNGNLTLLHTPNPILFDSVTLERKMLVLDGGSLGVQEPCWESASASP